MSKQTKIIIVLGIVIVLLLGFFAYTTLFQSYKDNLFQQGQTNAIAQIVQVAAQCERVPIPINETFAITLIAEECL